MKPLSVVSVLLVSLTSSNAAWAVGPDDIRSQMDNGLFAEVCVQAEQIQSAEGYALAAECLMSEVILGQARKIKRQAKRARELAETGLEMDPTHQNARLQYALADGLVTRETGDMTSIMKKLPQQTEATLEAYRADFPVDPRGDALLGAWNLAIIRKTGRKNGREWFGASVESGQSLFRDARMEDPNDPIINVNYAFALLALKEKDLGNTDEARQVLTEVVASHPTDYIGRVLKGYASDALSIIDNRVEASDYACRFLDGKVPVLPTRD